MAIIEEIKATFAGQEAEGIIAGIIKKFEATKDKHHDEGAGHEEEKEGGERSFTEEVSELK